MILVFTISFSCWIRSLYWLVGGFFGVCPNTFLTNFITTLELQLKIAEEIKNRT